MTVICRFAPSPTGYLHIGGARTALFNALYAKHTGGKFLLRIEDTDRERSTDESIKTILDGLTWLGLEWEGEPVFQFARADRHREVALQLLAAGKAYKCFATAAELDEMRNAQKAAGQTMRYDGRWRDRPETEAPAGAPYVVRLKAPQDGETVIVDQVLGEIRVQNKQLDDMVLLRSDGTPTYMLAVVVDDHDMGVTHVIRGNDHMTNTFRQVQIYAAMGWPIPVHAHLPLILGEDGVKLSKRHGAVGTAEYAKMGYLPEAMRNYLTRLGWAHGDDEIFSDAQAAEWFELSGIVKSPARFDFKKLDALNAHYMREASADRLMSLLPPFLTEANGGAAPTAEGLERVKKGLPSLVQRAKTLKELAASALVYIAPMPTTLDEKAAALLDADTRAHLGKITELFRASNTWTGADLEEKVRTYAEENGLKLGKLAQPLRVAITGTTVSPPIFEVAELLGRDEVLSRLQPYS